jgi:hypothetical protein
MHGRAVLLRPYERAMRRLGPGRQHGPRRVVGSNVSHAGLVNKTGRFRFYRLAGKWIGFLPPKKEDK